MTLSTVTEMQRFQFFWIGDRLGEQKSCIPTVLRKKCLFLSFCLILSWSRLCFIQNLDFPHCFNGDSSEGHKMPLSMGNSLTGDSSFHLFHLPCALHVALSSKCKAHYALMQLTRVSLKMHAIRLTQACDVWRNKLINPDQRRPLRKQVWLKSWHWCWQRN